MVTTAKQMGCLFVLPHDGITDDNDDCVDVANPPQADLDNDNIGDACDDDKDGDGYTVAQNDCDDTDAAFKHMNLEWKKIEARKNGGVVKLERRIKQGFAELQAKGITLTAAKTKHPNIAFEVDYGHIKKMVNGELQAVGQEYKQWMVMVPTVSHATAVDRNVRPPEMHNVLLNGFQIALCKKETNDWTFIDGAHITAAQLRQLFPFLPKKDEDLHFPNRGGRLLEK